MRITPRVGSTRTVPFALPTGTVGFPSMLWNNAVPLVATQPELSAQSRPSSRWNCRENCSASGERKSLVTLVRVTIRGLAGVGGAVRPARIPSTMPKELGVLAGRVVTRVNGKALNIFRKMLLKARS